jgi:hypothetical protein
VLTPREKLCKQRVDIIADIQRKIHTATANSEVILGLADSYTPKFGERGGSECVVFLSEAVSARWTKDCRNFLSGNHDQFRNDRSNSRLHSENRWKLTFVSSAAPMVACSLVIEEWKGLRK